jgi:hypothetical protein
MLRVILLAALIAAVLVLVFAPAAAAECFNQYECCWSFGSTGSGPGQFHGPRGFRAVLGREWDDQTYYVVDSGNGRVQVLRYTESDDWVTFERQIGRWGTGAGELSNPTGIELHGSILYVVDTGNHRIQLFTLDGAYVGQIGQYGQGDGEFDSPQFAAVIDDTLYVTDAGNHRVQKFTLDGAYAGQWGSEGSGPGQFLQPSGIASYVDLVAVGDPERGIVQVFTKSGVLTGTLPATAAEGPYTVQGYEQSEWVYDFLGYEPFNRACEGLVPVRPIEVQVGGMSWYIFTDFGNDRIVFWSFPEPVEPSTWGSLKTRYRD